MLKGIFFKIKISFGICKGGIIMYVREILVIIFQDLLKYGYLKPTMQGFVPYLALNLQISLKVYQ